MRDSGILFSHQVNLTRKYSSYDRKNSFQNLILQTMSNSDLSLMASKRDAYVKCFFVTSQTTTGIDMFGIYLL